jgi:hypothetical protein
MQYFEDSAEEIGELLEVQQATIQPLGLGTAAANIFNVQEAITDSDNEANELRELTKLNNFDDVDFSEYDESVNLAKTLLAEGIVPDAQAQLALANQIKENLYLEIAKATDENTADTIRERLGDQENLGLTKQDVKELEEILDDFTTDEDDAPGNSGDAPGNSGDAPGNSGDAPGNSGDAPGQNNDNKDFESAEDISGFDAAGDNPSANANGQGLGLGGIPPGLAKLFGYDDGTGDNKDFEGPVPPGFDAAGDNPSANANGQGLGLGQVPPGLYIAFNDKPDDFFENHYEAEIEDVYEVNYDGTNRGSADGKGMFGAWAGKSGQDPTTGQFKNQDKGQGNPGCSDKGINDGDAGNTGPISAGFSYIVDLVTAKGLGCNDITNLIFFNVISPNGTDINGPQPMLSPPTFIPDTDGNWIIDMGVQVYTEQRIVQVTSGITSSAGPDQLDVPLSGGPPSATVNLSGSGTGSAPPNLSYEWVIQRVGPGGGPPSLIDNGDGTASFTVGNTERGDEFLLTLIVRDTGNYGYAADSLTVTIES